MSFELDKDHEKSIYGGDSGKFPAGSQDLILGHVEKFQEGIDFLTDNLESFIANPKNFIDVLDPAQFKPEDLYTSFNRGKYAGATAITPKIDIAVGTIKKPLMVFRDVLTDKKSRAATQTEHFIGLTRFADGDAGLTYVFVHRTLLHTVKIRRLDAIDEILTELSGLPIFIRRI